LDLCYSNKMKLISLNAWGGILKDELREFMLEQAANTDIFCLQEIFHNAVNARKVLGNIDINLYDTLTELLPGYKGFYAPSQLDDEGLAFFVKPHINIDEVGDIFVHRYLDAMEDEDGTTIGRNIQFLKFNNDGKDYTVINFHGLWNGGGKTDSLDRLEQSRKIREYMDTQATGKVILIGDFNLEPETESVAILEKDMRNLIKEYGVTSTRSRHYKKPVKFADYAIVSNDLNVEKFEVLQDSVSDHLPLLLEFS
jgi:endonuclease/exonuclease/phosphatase family metal-dependent hydrolase